MIKVPARIEHTRDGMMYAVNARGTRIVGPANNHSALARMAREQGYELDILKNEETAPPSK